MKCLVLVCGFKISYNRCMSIWLHAFGWALVLINSLCLLRLGILPMIFFGRNYKLYGKIFWVSFFITLIFAMSEFMLIRMLVLLDIS